MMKMHLRISFNFIVLALVNSGIVAAPLTPANPPANNIPLHINSDHTQMDFKSGINIYEGHVSTIHGDSNMTGDKIITYRNKANKIEKIITTGNPATLHSAEDKDQQPIDAKASTITFYPLTHDVLLEGNASATQGKNIINAPNIQYNTESKIMKAQSTPTVRTHILIYNDDQANAGKTNS